MTNRKISLWSIALIATFVAAVANNSAFAADATPAAGDAAESFDLRAFLAPFHSVVLHLPIGFVTIALVLEIYSWINRGNSLRQAIGVVLWVSALSAIIAAVLGYLRAGAGGYEENALNLHQWSGIAVTVLTGIVALLHLGGFPRGQPHRVLMVAAYRFLLFINAMVLAIAGHYGGNLTHGSNYLVKNAPPWVKEWIDVNVPTILSGNPDPEIEAGSGVFAEVIRPVFEKKCFQCHGPEKQKGDYRMDTAEGLFTAGDSELDPIIPGRPMESYLAEVITLPTSDDLVMPPEGKEPLTPEETLAIFRWIWDGAESGAKTETEKETESAAGK